MAGFLSALRSVGWIDNDNVNEAGERCLTPIKALRRDLV